MTIATARVTSNIDIKIPVVVAEEVVEGRRLSEVAEAFAVVEEATGKKTAVVEAFAVVEAYFEVEVATN